MRILSIFFLILLCANVAFSASCPSGFNDLTNDFPATFYSKNGDLCPSGYEPFDAPSTMTFTFNGLILPDAPTTCSSGHYENGTCVPNAQDNCDTGFFKNTAYQATFYSKNRDLCPTGYEPYTYGDYVSFIFNGLILANAPTVCASGHYVDGVCTPLSSSDCITGYVDAGVDGVVASVLESGSCPTGYDLVDSYSECNSSTSSNMCTTLCNGGWLKTDGGFCSTACDAGFTRLRSGTGLSFTTYGTKTTEHAIVVMSESGVKCYVNLAPGGAKNAFNVKMNNVTYHSTN